MKKNEPISNLFFSLARLSAVMTRRFDSLLGGLGFNEFIILSFLEQAEEGMMRRIDLAEKIGLTASAITRLLLPMEKVGYIRRESVSNDGRVSLVALAAGGRRKLEEAKERMDQFIEEYFSDSKIKKAEEATKLINGLFPFVN